MTGASTIATTAVARRQPADLPPEEGQRGGAGGHHQDAQLELDRPHRVERAGQPPQRAIRGWSPSSRHLQRVADAVHGADQVGAELAAQRLDVAVDRAGAWRRAPAPHLGQQRSRGSTARGCPARCTSRSNSVGVRCASRRPGAPAARRRRSPGRRARSGAPSAARPPPLDAAQQRVHAGGQLPDGERLGQVVVGADGRARPAGRSPRRGRSASAPAPAARPGSAGTPPARRSRAASRRARPGPAADALAAATAAGPSAAMSTAKPSARSRAATDSAIVGRRRRPAPAAHPVPWPRPYAPPVETVRVKCGDLVQTFHPLCRFVAPRCVTQVMHSGARSRNRQTALLISEE